MADINYLFCGGDAPSSSIWKINIATMEKVAESDKYGDWEYALIQALTALDEYIYCSGKSDPENEYNKVFKIRKSDMVKVAESSGCEGWIYALTSFDSYVYSNSSAFKIRKIDPTDMSNVAESVSYGGNIYALINDGTYLYCAGVGVMKVWKIDPLDMSKVNESASYGGNIHCLATDNTYIYCAGATTRKVYKIQISDMSKVDESANYGATISALTVLGDYVYCAGLGSRKVWKIRISDMVKVDESASYGATIRALANDGTYVYCGGGGVDMIWKLDPTDMSKVAELDYEATIHALLVSLAPPAYDYPLAPVVFPAHKRGTSLGQKCIRFENSMSNVCLVVNHNTRVTREYLQLTYGDTTYPESSNLRFVLPSQQLVKLSNKDLTTKDYNAIINNFITNVSSMFTLINENNRLVKTWLDDYEPDELGHDFTDVKMKPIVIGKDLGKTMDSLFEGIIDNVAVLNMNLEVLKERF